MSQKNNRSGDRSRGPSRRGGRRRGGSSRGPRRSVGPPVEPLHPTENPPEIETFEEFDLHPTVQQVIANMDIVKPTPIQALAIVPVLEGRDVIAKAETGTGKTLAFGAPMISKIDADRVTVLGLCLCPTRELAEQVSAVLKKLGEPRDIKVALIVGGEPAGPQVAALHAGAQVVVGTPGRVIDLYEQRFLSFPWTEFVILDEADEMLEIGFIDDVKKILNFTPDERQTLLFSATFPDALLRLARDYTKTPAEVATASGLKTVDTIVQQYVSLDDADRPLALIRMIEQSEEDDIFLVFCERRTEVERLMRRLERLPFPIKALHGGYDQSSRFRVMGAFRGGEVKVLVATDVASRGLDVLHVTHVVNFSVPRSITDYTHRIGRTGRAGRDGHAMTLVTHEHMHRWKMLLRDASWEIEHVEPPGARPMRNRSVQPMRKGGDERRTGRTQENNHERSSRARGSRDKREGSDRDRGDRERSHRGHRGSQAAETPSRPQSSHNDPVTLPSKHRVRQRDPNDPPRRVRPNTDEREQIETTDGGERKGQSSRERRSSGARGDGGETRARAPGQNSQSSKQGRPSRNEEQQEPERKREKSAPTQPERPGEGFGSGV